MAQPKFGHHNLNRTNFVFLVHRGFAGSEKRERPIKDQPLSGLSFYFWTSDWGDRIRVEKKNQQFWLSLKASKLSFLIILYGTDLYNFGL